MRRSLSFAMVGAAFFCVGLLSGCITLPEGKPPSHHDVAVAEQQASRAQIACPVTTLMTLGGDVLALGGLVASHVLPAGAIIFFFTGPELTVDGVGVLTGRYCTGK